MAQHHAVDDVAERAAEHQRQGKRQPRLVRVAFEQAHDDDGGDDADRDEEPALPAAGIGEKAERRAGVVDQHQREERQHRDGFLVVERGRHPPFGEVVGDDDGQRHAQPFAHCRVEWHQAWLRASPVASQIADAAPAQAGMVGVRVDVVAVVPAALAFLRGARA